MKPFLKDIASYLYSSYNKDLKDICLVFPNQRAGLFLKKYLSELIPAPVWSPQIFTISDLMADMSDLSVADDLYLLFELYDIFCSEKKSKESFDNFYFWGEILLGDFDDIDKYLVNAEDLFRNINALKSIEKEFGYLSEEQIMFIKKFWQSFIPAGLENLAESGNYKISGKHQTDFLSTWEILFRVYTRLKEKLLADKLGYEGMVYRRVAEFIDHEKLPELSFNRICFIGFNALNECEKKLFRHLRKLGKAEFFWDYDDLYFTDRTHEAGRFIRKNIREFGISDYVIPSENLLSKKDIQVLSVPSESGQARILPGILSDISDLSHETAIILAEEKLLLPVLYSLPESISEFNVTMGYPVQETQLYNLIGHIIRLQENSRENEDGSCRFYSKDVLAILNHPSVYSGDEREIRMLVEMIIGQNLIFVNENLLNSHAVLRSFFTRIKDQSDVLHYILKILETIARRFQGQDDERDDNKDNLQDQENQIRDRRNQIPDQDRQSRALENEIIFQLFIRIKRLNEILHGRKVEFRINTLYRLIRKILTNTLIPFSGEPLSGLQIMGVLETRVLDFKNLVILSMNEGIFPKSPVRHSFIPNNLRYGFNLPTVEHHDAIYSYYFYRLIQRAEKVILVFNSKTEGMTGGEQSRFLHQLIFNKQFNVNEKVIAYNIQANPERAIAIKKNEKILEQLREYCKESAGNKYLSPRALNMYLDCSLQFYFNFVAGLKEPEELKEEIDPRLFGSLLHAAINRLYEPFKTEILSAELLKGMLTNNERITLSVNHAFKEVYHFEGEPGNIKMEGSNIIIRDIIVKYLREIISRDMHYARIRMVDMEQIIKIRLPVNIEGVGSTVAVGGKVDRIDYIGDLTRIIDYKTGRVDQEIESIDTLFDRNNKERNGEIFQVILYAMLVHSSMPGLVNPIIPGLYPIMDLNKDDFDYRIKIGSARQKEVLEDFRKINDEFTLKLTELVEEIFNTKVPFSQTTIVEKCRYCPYRRICHR
jgi:CRISPR/Cas system-associated exonuclease Cas4 (RecB family)